MKSKQLKPSNRKMNYFRCLMVAAALVSLVCIPESAVADRYKTTDTSTPQEVAEGMGVKLTRGIANIATGWIEFPKQIYSMTDEEGWGKGLTIGPIKGIVMVLVRTASGAVEVLTFPVPYPGFYDPFFDPEFVWQKE